MIIQMRIASLLIDPNTGLPIVVLVEKNGRRTVPIVIGMAEAEAIALALQQAAVSRPRTHDLMRSILTTLGGFFERMVIQDLRDSTFFATLYVRQSGRLLEIDSRPSDAMALACRTETPIFIEETVLERARMRLPEDAEDGEEASADSDSDAGDEPRPTFVPVAIDPDASVEELEEILKNLDPEDFGKYKM